MYSNCRLYKDTRICYSSFHFYSLLCLSEQINIAKTGNWNCIFTEKMGHLVVTIDDKFWDLLCFTAAKKGKNGAKIKVFLNILFLPLFLQYFIILLIEENLKTLRNCTILEFPSTLCLTHLEFWRGVFQRQFGVPSYLSDFGITVSLIQSQSISSNWVSVKDPTHLHKFLIRKKNYILVVY